MPTVRVFRTWWWGSPEELGEKQAFGRALNNFLQEAFTKLNGKESDRMSKKFNKGDTISIEATVKYAYTDGSLDLVFPFKPGAEYANAEDVTSARLVKKAVPPVPTAGTVIRYGTTLKYIVKRDGELNYIDDTGNPEKALWSWATLDHNKVTILG